MKIYNNYWYQSNESKNNQYNQNQSKKDGN